MASRSPPRASAASKEGTSPEQSAPEPPLDSEQPRDLSRVLARRPPTPPKPILIGNFRRRSTQGLPKTISLPNNPPNHADVSNGVHPNPVPSLPNGSQRKLPRPASSSLLATGHPAHPPALRPKPMHLVNAPQKRKTSRPLVLQNGEEKKSLDVTKLNGTDHANGQPRVSISPLALAAKFHCEDVRSNHSKGDYEQEMQAFMDVSKEACNVLQSFHKKYGVCIVSERQRQAVEQTKHVLQEKEICITVFGQHNCGKSTFLNALIGEEILPVFAMSETSIKVKIQHNVCIHTGVCPPECSLRCCPQLHVMRGKENVEQIIYGPQNIYAFLSQKNKEIRRAQDKASVKPLTVILKLNIPLLSGSIPPGWTVSIMDNPGFGEAKEHITQLAEASMVTSSAYIYLMQTENVGGREAAEFFTELLRTDKRAIVDGRLTTGITKFDTNYESSKLNKTGSVTVEDVKERIIESVQDVTGTIISSEMIIPICGEWALAGSKLANCLISDPKGEKGAKYDNAVLVLQKCPHLSLPGGQGQSCDDAIRTLYPPVDLVQKLENISGVTDLKARIGYVVGSACVKVWATKIHTQLQTTLFDVKEMLGENTANKESDYRGKSSSFSNSVKLLKEIKDARQALNETLDRTGDRIHLEIWKKFERSYTQDLKKSKPQEAGKDKAKSLIIEFRDMCKKKIEEKQLGPTEFEDCLKEFLEASESKLQKVFDTACGFWNCQNLLMKEIEGVIKDVSSMKRSADILLKTSPTTDSNGEDADRHTGINQVRSCRNFMKSPPKLGDIKLKVSIPQVSLPWWKRIVHFFRGLWRPSDVPSSTASGPSSETPSCDSSDCTSEAQGGAAVFAAYQPDISDASDVYDDDDPWPESSVAEGDEKLEEDGKSDQADAKERPANPSTINKYSEWIPQLEETVKEVQMYMYKACEQYFIDIEQTAIKYFYQVYYRKTEEQLNEFNCEFDEPLQKEEECLVKLKKEIKIMKKELKELEQSRDALERFEKKLCDTYAAFTKEREEHLRRECVKKQHRSLHKELEVARDKTRKLKEVVKEIDSL